MLRDKFAMAAMQGFCANLGFYSINDDVAERAYQMADAMMREREKLDFSDDQDSQSKRATGVPPEVETPPIKIGY